MKHVLCIVAALILGLCPPVAMASPSDIGVVVMHGKGGSPHVWVNELADALSLKGYQVANLEMPWSKNRQYDVGMEGGVDEITSALTAMRAKGAKKIFVAGHSQGGLFALYFGGHQAVDGLIAIAPGGNHGAGAFRNALGAYVSKARTMIDEGHGGEKADFADYEGKKGSFPVITMASTYYDWFNPDGPHNMDYVVRNVKSGTPVLYIAPTRDYPALKKYKTENFRGLPKHALTRMYEPETDHLHSPVVSAEEIIRWINEVAGS